MIVILIRKITRKVEISEKLLKLFRKKKKKKKTSATPNDQLM